MTAIAIVAMNAQSQAQAKSRTKIANRTGAIDDQGYAEPASIFAVFELVASLRQTCSQVRC